MSLNFAAAMVQVMYRCTLHFGRCESPYSSLIARMEKRLPINEVRLPQAKLKQAVDWEEGEVGPVSPSDIT